ncbi:MAG TPA: hypothetical protein PLP17_00135 [Oligoflexia bacterium]|nr:hypothetical protein [Oligoflexia bacterium]
MEIEDYIAEKHVGGSLLSILRRLEAQDSRSVCALIEAINPSANTLRGLLDLVYEICRRDARKLHEVLALPVVHDVVRHEKLSRKEKQKALRIELEALRYPQMNSVRCKINAAQQELLRQFGLRVEAPKDLEGDTLTVRLSVRSLNEFADYAEKLKLLSRHPAAGEMFKLLRGE